MRKAVFIILFAAIGLTSIDAAATDYWNWHCYGVATLFEGEDVSLYYDDESVERTSRRTVKVWVKALLLSELVKFSEKIRAKTLYEIDCTDKIIRTLSIIDALAKNGECITS